MDQSNTDPLGQNSLYQIEHDNSQLHVLNRPLLNQFRAGPMNPISNPISRMGLAVDQNNALNQTGLSALSLSNLNITWHLSNQGAANVAANRQLLAKAAQASLGIQNDQRGGLKQDLTNENLTLDQAQSLKKLQEMAD